MHGQVIGDPTVRMLGNTIFNNVREYDVDQERSAGMLGNIASTTCDNSNMISIADGADNAICAVSNGACRYSITNEWL